MRESTQMYVKGLFLILLAVCFTGIGLRAQGINNLVKEVTTPAKDAQKVIKGASEPARDVNKGIKTATDAPTKVVKEYERTGSEIERTKKEYEKTGDQIEKVTGGGDDKNKKPADSTSTKTADAAKADGKTDGKTNDELEHKTAIPADYVPVKKAEPAPVAATKGGDPMDMPKPVPPGSRDNKTPSGPLPPSEVTKTVATGGTENDPAVSTETETETPADATLDPAVNPTATARVADPADPSSAGNQAASSEEVPTRLVEVRTVPRSGEKRPKPDYSHSPARIPLEKAEFDIETLEDLFRYSNWEGPEREHTVRAVANALDEMQQSIVDIKKLDPGQSTWRFEESYKDMKAAYIAEMKKQKQ